MVHRFEIALGLKKSYCIAPRRQSHTDRKSKAVIIHQLLFLCSFLLKLTKNCEVLEYQKILESVTQFLKLIAFCKTRRSYTEFYNNKVWFLKLKNYTLNTPVI